MSITGIDDLLKHINQTHGTNYRLVAQFQDGEQGAFEIADGDDRAVLKRHPGAGAVERYTEIGTIVDLLRDRGYPAPRYTLIGTNGTTSYAIQTAMPGAISEQLAPIHVSHLIELNRLQLDAAPAADPDWQAFIARSVINGFDEYCVIGSLREYSDETATLLSDAQVAARDWESVPYRSSDIVHFDFHHRNILVDGDVVTGVIDWDGVSAGDCVFDLVTLLFYSRDGNVREAILSEMAARSDRTTALAYLAHMTVRQLDWVIRFYDAESVEQVIAIVWRNLQEIMLHVSG